jgi:hypothetical protein
LLANPSRAQEPGEPDGNKDLAGEWADKAQDRFEAGDFQGAIDALIEARKHARPPTFTLLLAQAHEKLGHLLEAAGIYQSIVDLSLPPNSKASWVKAREGAKKDLAALTPRIPKVEIHVTGVAPSALTVALDGVKLDLSKLDVPIPQNPGRHKIVLSSSGYRTVTREVVLEQGKTEQVTVEMLPVEVLPTARPTAPATGAPTSISTATALGRRSGEQGNSFLSVGRYVSFGLAGAGLVAGAITGGLVLSQSSDIGQVCNLGQKKCRLGSMAGVESIGTLGDVATASFVVAGVGAAAGAVLLFFPRKKAAQVGVAFGPAGLSVEGSF